jgi:putative addiction module component (TIGR02574 family)
MTQEDILSTIQSLPAQQQYAIASSILDRLTLSGQVTLSDAMRDEIRRRDIEFEQNPNNGEPWKDVKKQIFDA